MEEEYSNAISLQRLQDLQVMRWRCLRSRPKPAQMIYFFRPTPLHLIFLLLFILCVYQWIQLRFENVHKEFDKSLEDLLEENMTDFIQSHDVNFMVFKRIRTAGRLGDFSCSSSTRWSKCAFFVENLFQATQICNAFGDVCKAFVLTAERGRLMIYLKHDVVKVERSKKTALFVKKVFAPKMKGLREIVRYFMNRNGKHYFGKKPEKPV